MDERDKILAEYAAKDVDTLDRERDKKILELRECLSRLYKAKDSELVKRHEKRKQLIAEGNSLSKTEQLLKGDDGLFLMKRIVMELSDVKNKISLELEVIKNYFWKARM